MGKIFYCIVVLGVIASCNLDNRQYTNELKNLDAHLEQNPEWVWDSLKKMEVDKFNTAQCAYYYLLNASATDKNLVYLEEDSTLLFSLEYYTDQEDHYNIARCQYYLGKYTHKRNRPKKAYALYKQAELNAKQSKKDATHLLGLIYYQLGQVLKQEFNYLEAENFVQKSFEKFMESKDTISAIYSLKLKGLIKINQKKYNEAKENLFNSYNLISSCRKNSLKKLLAENGVLVAISYYYLQIKEINKSLEYIKQCISSLAKNNISIPSQYYFDILRIYKSQNQIDSAKFYCHKMIKVAQNEKNGNNILNGYKVLSYFAAKEGNYSEAYSLNKYVSKLKDSIVESTHQNNLLELERRFNETEAKRLLLKAENSKLRAYAIVTIILFALIIIGLPLYKRHKKLKMKYDRLSEAIKHTEWGFLVTKEFITENHIAYDELERMLNREKSLNTISPEFYNRFHDALIQQKASYSGRLFNRLTSFDGTFGTKFQQLFPDFNTDELLMASMIHHQWKIADMTTIFHASVDAIRKRKARLANKISAKLQKEIDLDEFLSNL